MARQWRVLAETFRNIAASLARIERARRTVSPRPPSDKSGLSETWNTTEAIGAVALTDDISSLQAWAGCYRLRARHPLGLYIIIWLLLLVGKEPHYKGQGKNCDTGVP